MQITAYGCIPDYLQQKKNKNQKHWNTGLTEMQLISGLKCFETIAFIPTAFPYT